MPTTAALLEQYAKLRHEASVASSIVNEIAKRLERIGPHAVRGTDGFTLSRVPGGLDWCYEELGRTMRIQSEPGKDMWFFYLTLHWQPASEPERDSARREQIIRNVLESLKLLNPSSAFVLETPDGNYYHPSY